MKAKFHIITFKKLMKVVGVWSESLIFGFSKDKIEVQTTSDFITMIFVEMDMNTMEYLVAT